MRSCVLTVSCCLVLALFAGCWSEAPKAAPKSPQPVAAKPAQPPKPAQMPVAAKPAQPPKPEKRDSWDFAKLHQDQWEWVFPDGAKPLGSRGASFECDGGVHELRWNGQPFEASDYKGLRIHVTMTREKKDGTGREPVDVGGSPYLHWTWPGEAKMNKDWPLDMTRRSRAYRPDKKNAYLWEFPLAKNAVWKGRIGGLALLLNVRELDGMRVDVKSIELVK